MRIGVMYKYISYRGIYYIPSRLFIVTCILYSQFSKGSEPTSFFDLVLLLFRNMVNIIVNIIAVVVHSIVI